MARDKSSNNWLRAILAFAGLVVTLVAIWQKYKQLKVFARKYLNADTFSSLEQIKTAKVKSEVEKHVKELVSSAVERGVSELGGIMETKVLPPTTPTKSSKPAVAFRLTSRQEQIYQHIKQNTEANMASISQLVSGVTNRTLRRDMTKLEKLGLVRQVGKTRDTIYRTRD